MAILIELLIFVAIAGAAYFFLSRDKKAKVAHLNQPDMAEELFKRSPVYNFLQAVAVINKPFPTAFKESLSRRLAAAKFMVSAEQFLLIKELVIIALIILFLPMLKELAPTFYLIPVIVGYFLPEVWIMNRINYHKREITRALPDVIDLLALCVNAGLDFMLALKWVVEKSAHNLLIDELNILMREINLGKPRKNALMDLAKRYDIAELASFSRSLVQADRMGTSVADALNILSEDMRLARFRRGEQMALKAPLKMLIPLLLFIFPVVGVIIGGPIILQFMQQKSFVGM